MVFICVLPASSRLSRRVSHQPYCIGQRSISGSAPSACAACSGQFGSYSASRPMAIEVGAAGLQRFLGLLRREDQADRHGLDAGLLAHALGERHLESGHARNQGRVAAVAEPWMPPEEQSTTSTPLAFSSFAKTTPCLRCASRLRRRRWTRCARRAACDAGHALRTARTTSSGKRMRFSTAPPYWSVRRLESGERKVCSR